MHLFVLRHGETQEGYNEKERPLTQFGERQAHYAGYFLKRLDVFPDVILSSPLVRAQRTAEIVRGILGVREVITTEYLIPGSDYRKLIEQLNLMQGKNPLLVGHEPHLSEFIAQLIGGIDFRRIEMRKGYLAGLNIPLPIVRGTATLILLVNPIELKIGDFE